jgi:N-acetylmuramoyl-L-alanine amidase
MKVALVIGHKASSPGACNKTHNICEFEFNEKLVKDVVDEIDGSLEHEIVYRETYNGLPDKINATNPDCIVSFHCNAFNTKASGTEVLYYHKSKKGKAWADKMQDRLKDALGLPDRGIKGKSSEDRGGYVLRYTSAPCILIEPFFIDNDNDYGVVTYNYRDLVRAITNGIKDFVGI